MTANTDLIGNRMTERARYVLELSLREALALGHNYIGTEHILLALMREQEGLAGVILKNLGLERETVRGEVLRTLNVKCETCGEIPRRRET